jgi:hypothetical protein
MTNFYVLDGSKKQGTAVNTEKATEMLSLMFPGQKAFVVDDGKVPFAQNMTIAEAEDSAGIKSIKPVVVEPVVVEPVTQSMEVLPDEPPVKKTKVKSKVVVKSKPAKTTKVKSKVVVGKAKKPVAKKPVKKVVAKKPVAKKKNVKKK